MMLLSLRAILPVLLVPSTASALVHAARDFVDVLPAQQKGATSNLLPNVHSASELSKRQPNMFAVHGAVIQYHCLVSGDQHKSFIWRANYDAETQQVVFTTVRNIDLFEHVDMVANDFSTRWHHKYCWNNHEHCCVYTIKAKVMGAVYDDHISQWLETGGDANDGIVIREFCISSCGQMCAAHDMINHLHYNQCTIRSIQEYT